MKIIVAYYSSEKVVKASVVKAKLIELGFQPLSVRKRKIRHVFNHWFVELPETIVGTCEGVDEAKAKAYPSLYCINFIRIHPNEVQCLNKGKYSYWDKQLTPILEAK